MPNITEITNSSKSSKVTCIYVVLGREVMRREEDSHPGMGSVRAKWDHEESAPNSMIPRMIRSSREGVFYWDHMDARGNHVFVCHAILGNQMTPEVANAAPVL